MGGTFTLPHMTPLWRLAIRHSTPEAEAQSSLMAALSKAQKLRFFKFLSASGAAAPQGVGAGRRRSSALSQGNCWAFHHLKIEEEVLSLTLREEAAQLHALCGEALAGLVDDAVLARHLEAAGKYEEALELFMRVLQDMMRQGVGQTVTSTVAKRVRKQCIAHCDQSKPLVQRAELRIITTIITTWSATPDEFPPLFARWNALMATDAQEELSFAQRASVPLGAWLNNLMKINLFDPSAPEDSDRWSGGLVGSCPLDLIAETNLVITKALQSAFSRPPSPSYALFFLASYLMDSGEEVHTAAQGVLGPGALHAVKLFEHYDYNTWHSEVAAFMAVDIVLCMGPANILTIAGELSQANKAHTLHKAMLERHLADEELNGNQLVYFFMNQGTMFNNMADARWQVEDAQRILQRVCESEAWNFGDGVAITIENCHALLHSACPTRPCHMPRQHAASGGGGRRAAGRRTAIAYSVHILGQQ